MEWLVLTLIVALAAGLVGRRLWQAVRRATAPPTSVPDPCAGCGEDCPLRRG